MRPQLSALVLHAGQSTAVESLWESSLISLSMGSPFPEAGHPALEVHVSHPIFVAGLLARGAAETTSRGPQRLCMAVDRLVPPQSHKHTVDEDTKHPRNKRWALALLKPVVMVEQKGPGNRIRVRNIIHPAETPTALPSLIQLRQPKGCFPCDMGSPPGSKTIGDAYPWKATKRTPGLDQHPHVTSPSAARKVS